MFNENRDRAIKLFKSFMQQANDDCCLDDKGKSKKNWTAAELTDLLFKLAGFKDYNNLCNLDKANRDELLLRLREEGLTIRKIEELTGLGRGVIERVTRD